MPAAPRLRELQQGFAAAVLGRDDSVSTWIDGGGLEPAARLRVYEHAIAATLTAALRDSYPGVLALVGKDFFDAMAARYRRHYPSTSGNLQHFGAALADFLADMPEAHRLPYLPDVARLEWCRQLTALAADATTVDASRCAEVAAAAPERLRVCLHPSVHLLRSAHAVLNLWQWCQAPSDIAPSVDEGEQVLLWREDGEVAMATLEPATFRCIEMLAGGNDVATAWAGACDMDHAFDLESCLRDLLGHNLIVAFTDEGTSP
ncbi:MAG: DNA-binding domain-containing protein [Pseudomonadota bacterium]|nr:DNA-binding domain-containing protein [Pseudomonadota bacterium]